MTKEKDDEKSTVTVGRSLLKQINLHKIENNYPSNEVVLRENLEFLKVKDNE